MPKGQTPAPAPAAQPVNQEARNKEIATVREIIDKLGGMDAKTQTRLLRTVIVFYGLNVDLMPNYRDE